MKEFKGTKGEWFAARDANGLGIFTEREKICTLFEHRHSGEEVDANASLIVAAPELLKALLSITEYWNTPQESNLSLNYHIEHSLRLAKKAINKALGL